MDFMSVVMPMLFIGVIIGSEYVIGRYSGLSRSVAFPLGIIVGILGCVILCFGLRLFVSFQKWYYRGRKDEI